MQITVARLESTALSTPGKLSLDGVFQCVTLEPPQRKSSDQPKPYCIPAGTYKVALLWSAHFNCLTPHVLDVPGFTEIEIHWGNYPKDTEGCCLVGRTAQTDFIGVSREAFIDLMQKLVPNKDNLSITYEDWLLQAA